MASAWSDLEALNYIASYSDLIAALGADPNAGRAHYNGSGWLEGRTVNFDALAYIASYGDLIAAFGTDAEAGARHYILAGHAEGRAVTFDGLAYIASYGDLIAAFGADADAGARHYIVAGHAEGRAVTFDGLAYIASYGDLIAAFGADADAGARHYIVAGHAEGRTVTFDGLAYIASYGDLIAAFGANADAGARHYIVAGHAEGRTVTFDGLAYIASYGDLIAAFGANADAGARHYIVAGHAEGRTVTFDGLAYIASYGDLIAAFGANADAGARHYIVAGHAEGRTVTFDAVAYLLTHPDLAGLGIQGATTQWIQYGYAHGSDNGGATFGHEQTNHGLALGQQTAGAIDTAGDHDWYQLTLTAGQQIAVLLKFAAGTGAGVVTVYDATGRQITSDSATSGTAVAAFTASQTGSYYITTNATGGATGSYTLSAKTMAMGTPGNDTLTGTSGDDVLVGLAGNDALTDRAGGNDQLFGQDGNDTLTISRLGTAASNTVLLDGGAGDDTLSFDGGDRLTDTVTAEGGTGNDVISILGAANATIDAGDGDDVVTINLGGTATVTLGAGADTVTLAEPAVRSAGESITVTDFQPGIDQLNLTPYLTIASNWNTLTNPFANGILRLVQSGADTQLQIDPTGGGTNWSTLITFQNTTASAFTARDLGYDPNGWIYGTTAADTISGTPSIYKIRGLDGNDSITGGDGNNVLEGGNGDDTLIGGTGDDVLYGNNADNSGGDTGADFLADSRGGNDRLFGQDGNDILTVNRIGLMAASTVLLDGGAGDDSLIFTGLYKDTVTLVGGAGNDTITATGASTATINAGDGNDVVTVDAAGQQTSTVTLGAGTDTLVPNWTTPITPIAGTITVTDFQVGTDQVQLGTFLGHVLTNWNQNLNPFGNGFLRLMQSGSDTLLQLDANGGGDSWSTFITFQNTTAGTFTAHDLGYTPDGSTIGTAGNDTLTDTTVGGSRLFGLDGNDTLTVNRFSDPTADTILLDGGAGDDTLSFDGGRRLNDTATAKGGTGNDVISILGAANATIDAGDGDDVVTVELDGTATVTLGAGADTLNLTQSTGQLGGKPLTVTDFQPGTDQVTLNNFQYLTALAGWNQDTNPFGGFLRLTQSGSDTLLEVNPNGGNAGWSTLITFQNTTASAFTARDLGYAPDGSTTGTAGNDTLRGGASNDFLYGGAGDDDLEDNNGGSNQLFGQDGNDSLLVRPPEGSPAATDLLDGGDGNDSLFYGAYWDANRNLDTVTLVGGTGNDTVTAVGAAQATLDGGDGADVLSATGGQVTLTGGAGDDNLSVDRVSQAVLSGGDGADTLSAVGGVTTLDGGAGDDVITVDMGSGMYTVTLGDGADTLTLTQYPFTATNATVTVTDFQVGTDTLALSSYLNNALSGWDQRLNPFAGFLRLTQSGSDTLLQINANGSGSTWATLVTFQNTTASAFTTRDLGYAPDGSTTGTAGDDTIQGSIFADSLYGGAGNDYLADSAGGNDQMFGQDGDDTLSVTRYGSMLTSTVLMDGGLGNDSLTFDGSGRSSGLDTVTMTGGAGNDALTVKGAAQATLDGGDGADVLSASGGVATLDGGAGDDSVTVDMASGTYTVTLGDGADTISAATALNVYNPSTTINVTDFQVGTDHLALSAMLGQVLSGWVNTTNPFDGGYLQLKQSGSDTLLQIDTNGGGDNWSTLMTLQNTTATSFTSSDLGYTPTRIT
ncbi:hypothetical protein UAJ10_13275 [Nitrospirillum sp. BR 11164]|uniref:beta strand repeat-containing protein n=1 Tax=Nitrospirillum sp. BR 11164 TaxID=3104324 RepID=UPI002AFEF8FA|nr:hypothetical protein [Nitrospirillum sp. BR 11164]MEA1649976.1 hypothetical protein [Nitrospirillum sp. BR 11164]